MTEAESERKYLKLKIGFFFCLYPYLDCDERCNIKDLVVRSQIHSGEKRPIWMAEERKNRGFSWLEASLLGSQALPFLLLTNDNNSLGFCNPFLNEKPLSVKRRRKAG
jgi:hypothetical protein